VDLQPDENLSSKADAFELQLETQTKEDLFSEKSSYKGQARDSIAWLSVKLEGGVTGWPEGTDDLDGHQRDTIDDNHWPRVELVFPKRRFRQGLHVTISGFRTAASVF
jgi:hypothetical protein